MKHIKRLVKLAEQYANYGVAKGMGLREHNYIGNNCTIYFGDEYRIAAIKFGNIEVNLFSNAIILPHSISKEDLSDTHRKYSKMLEDIKHGVSYE